MPVELFRVVLDHPLSVSWKGTALDPPSRLDAQRLLVYLLLTGDRGPVPRSSVADDLWPTEPVDRRRGRLRAQLHVLKRYLAENTGCDTWWRSSRMWLAWRPEIEVRTDLGEFIALATRALDDHPQPVGATGADLTALQAALEAAPRELLPRWTDPWLDEPRRELGLLRRRVQRALVRGAYWGGLTEFSAQLARDWALTDRSREARAAAVALARAVGWEVEIRDLREARHGDEMASKPEAWPAAALQGQGATGAAGTAGAPGRAVHEQLGWPVPRRSET